MTDPQRSIQHSLSAVSGDQVEEGLRAAIYARTSSASQAFGYSIDGQVRRCWDRCQQMGWTVSHVYCDEAVSGKDTDRPMFQELLSYAEAGAFDVVVFWKLDRFSRSLMHAVQLEKEFREWGVALHSITENIDTTTPTGRFNFRNISSASEFERELNQQRSKMGMTELAMERKWPNDHPPLGYQKCEDDTLEIDSEEADLVKSIFTRYLELRSMPELASELNQDGISTAKGKEWSARAVSGVLRNQLYIGQYNVADVEAYVSEYQIIDESLFDRVTSVRTRFTSEEKTERESMSKTRKEEQVMRVVDQFREYATQSLQANSSE
jgi:site-specific DNA recombinase